MEHIIKLAREARKARSALDEAIEAVLGPLADELDMELVDGELVDGGGGYIRFEFDRWQAGYGESVANGNTPREAWVNVLNAFETA